MQLSIILVDVLTNILRVSIIIVFFQKKHMYRTTLHRLDDLQYLYAKYLLLTYGTMYKCNLTSIE